MKTKSLILEILLIIIPIFGAYLIVQHQLDNGKTTQDIVSLLVMFLPASIGYWITKYKIYQSDYPNPARIVRIWQYLILGFYISCIIFFILFSENIIEKNLRNIGILWLSWMVVYGNFQAKIFPFTEGPIYFFVPSTNIQKRTHRFTGKFLFFGGIFGIFLLLILPKQLGEYFLLCFVLLYFFLPFVYRLNLQSKEPA